VSAQAVAAARQQELEQRKSAKLKFFELRSSIERLYGRVVVGPGDIALALS